MLGWIQSASKFAPALKELFTQRYNEAKIKERITPDTLLPNSTPHSGSATLLATSPDLDWPMDEPLLYTFTVPQRTPLQLCQGVKVALRAIHKHIEANRKQPLFRAHKFTYAVSVVGGNTPQFQDDMGKVLQSLLHALQNMVHIIFNFDLTSTVLIS